MAKKVPFFERYVAGLAEHQAENEAPAVSGIFQFPGIALSKGVAENVKCLTYLAEAVRVLAPLCQGEANPTRQSS